jgi:hypothetical protein
MGGARVCAAATPADSEWALWSDAKPRQLAAAIFRSEKKIGCGVSRQPWQQAAGRSSQHMFTENRVGTAEVVQRLQLLMQGSVSAAFFTSEPLLRRSLLLAASSC